MGKNSLLHFYLKILDWTKSQAGNRREAFSSGAKFFVTAIVLTSCQAGFNAGVGLISSTEKDFSNTAYDTFIDVAKPVATIVDNQYPENRELLKTRYQSNATNYTDTCHADLSGKNTFADRISWAVKQRMRPMKPEISYVATIFGVSSNMSTYKPTGLLTHPLCRVSTSSLNTTFEGHNVPAQSTIDKINKFVDTMNRYRQGAIAGDSNMQMKAQRLWSKLYMCLSYMESLTTADVPSSDSLADNNLPSGVRRPAGVSYYYNGLLNVGLYQFDPDSGGDIQSCIREWNDYFPSCQIDRNASNADTLNIIGSSHQTFNAFCGVSKFTAMIGVQVNTTRAKNTFPSNVKSDGSLLPADSRCVSFNMNVNTSYNHFAPFQNGSGFTLDNIMTCATTGEM